MTIANNSSPTSSQPAVILSEDIAFKFGTGQCIVLWPAVIEFVLRTRGRFVEVLALLEDIASIVDPRCRHDNWRAKVIEWLRKRAEFCQLGDGRCGLREWPRPNE